MKVYQILPGLYMRGSFKNLSLQQKLEELTALDVHLVVCLLRRNDSELALALETTPFSYRTIPIPDATYLDLPAVHRAKTAVLQQLSRGGNVLVHCVAGKNRSGLVCALVARDLLNLTGEAALKLVQCVRPTALNNPVMVTYLKGLSANA